jgi:hypothetical protein
VREVPEILKKSWRREMYVKGWGNSEDKSRLRSRRNRVMEEVFEEGGK